jgi:hypothetical protein
MVDMKALLTCGLITPLLQGRSLDAFFMLQWDWHSDGG